jgi:hypothetical protein
MDKSFNDMLTSINCQIREGFEGMKGPIMDTANATKEINEYIDGKFYHGSCLCANLLS